MTSLDDDGSTHDAARQSAPADPWLTEAPTSAISDAATLRDLTGDPSAPPLAATTPFPGTEPASTAPFPAAAPAASSPFPDATPAASSPFPGAAPAASSPFPGAAPIGWPDKSRTYHPRSRRQRRRLVIAVLAVGAVFIAGLIALDPFGSDNEPNAKGPARVTSPTAGRPASPPATTTQATSAQAAPAAAPTTSATSAAAAPVVPMVVYEVTASGSGNTGNIAYTDEDGDIIRRNGIPLPWRTTFGVGERRKPLVLDAQRKGGGDNGPVTCTITVGGKVVATTTADGKYASALCSGSA
ncbi:MmpS family transport accessory protein [Actinoplanes subglobosus]|uniref:MmpS family transport accessory protein n=1 Tax=Actinoplanes subglobosus TaxID=1547892 RepID=A0ABV8IQG7_9ACTN